MNRALRSLDADERERLKRRGMPKWTAPMLAKLTHDHFSSHDWIYERKLDGERCLVFHDGRGTRLLSRNRKRLNGSYPELAEAAQRACGARFIADGEIVAFEGSRTSFSRLQQRMRFKDPDKARKSGVAVYLYVFDLLYFDGYDLARLSLRARKQVLRKALRFDRVLRFTAHRNASGEKYLREACRKGWEGLIAKKADGRYVHGRSSSWLKFKCTRRQELVIGGYTEPGGSRKGFGALLVGYYENGDLQYAGKVGTGYDDKTLESLGRKLRARSTGHCPFEQEKQASRKGVHWVKPTLVAEIGFTEWTRDGRLRHPRYLGLRRDKSARKVTRESAEA